MRDKRERIAGIIRDLHEKQLPNSKRVTFPKLVFTPESGAGYSSEEDEEDEQRSKAKEDTEKKVSPSKMNK